MQSGMVDNVGIAVGIATPSLAVQKLFPLPILPAAILNFGSLPPSTNVDQRRQTSCSVLSVQSKSGVVENVGVAVVIMSVCRWKLKLHLPAEHLYLFPWRVLLVVQVQGARKSHIHAENAVT